MARSMSYRRSWIAVAVVLLALAPAAQAIGWDSDDFIMSGGPQGPAQLGVFDHDLTFKGFLEPGWSRGFGLDFDAAGNFVAMSFIHREVRSYGPGGAIVGGFFDKRLAAGGTLRVAASGNYVIGQGTDFGGQGVVEFTPQGGFVRQFGGGDLAVVEIVGNKLWGGRSGDPNIRVFDLATGVEESSLTVAGLSGVYAIEHSQSSNTVLFGHPFLGRVIETDLTGQVIRTFQGPTGASIYSITRGPNGDVFAAVGTHIWQWTADGQFVREVSGSTSLGLVSGITWAGNVPEPTISVSLLMGLAALLRRRRI